MLRMLHLQSVLCQVKLFSLLHAAQAVRRVGLAQKRTSTRPTFAMAWLKCTTTSASLAFACRNRTSLAEAAWGILPQRDRKRQSRSLQSGSNRRCSETIQLKRNSLRSIAQKTALAAGTTSDIFDCCVHVCTHPQLLGNFTACYRLSGIPRTIHLHALATATPCRKTSVTQRWVPAVPSPLCSQPSCRRAIRPC